jgi:hypothetical protein
MVNFNFFFPIYISGPYGSVHWDATSGMKILLLGVMQLKDKELASCEWCYSSWCNLASVVLPRGEREVLQTSYRSCHSDAATQAVYFAKDSA